MMITREDHFSQEMQRCRDYITALEQERKKIQVFQRELPLSLELVQQAIETCKQQLPECNNLPAGHLSECSEQTTTSGDVVPVFEEFIPIKRSATSSSSQSDGGEEHESDKIGKSDWLRSVQLWNQSPDPSPKEGSMKKLDEGKSDNGGFQPFKKDKSVENGGTTPPPPLPESGGGSKKDDKDGNRKTRRCWSPELHRRFLQALQQLGGSHVATPKQIREFMKVEGLTNDEVKSHLQKYRLHTRRPSPQNTTTTQTPQFVVVGGIWVPPEYTTMATTAASSPPKAASAGIYAPIASIPQLRKPLASNDGGSGSDAGRRSNSPATSSSTYVMGVTTSSDY